jgi:hypothetical protein
MTSRTSIAWKVSPHLRVPGRDAPKVGAMLDAAAIAIVGGVAAVAVAEVDAARAAAVADIMAAVVGAEDAKASLVVSKNKIQGPQRCGPFCLRHQRIAND